MEINSTGEGLHVLIDCEYLLHHDWMGLLAWYSVYKNLPDATAGVMCRRDAKYNLFTWVKKLGVRFRWHPVGGPREERVRFALADGFVRQPLLVMAPDVVAARELEPARLVPGFHASPGDKVWFLHDRPDIGRSELVPWLCSTAKSEAQTPFVDYEKGWCRFVTPRWINTPGYPFGRNAIGKEFMTCNELQLLKLWQQVGSLCVTL